MNFSRACLVACVSVGCGVVFLGACGGSSAAPGGANSDASLPEAGPVPAEAAADTTAPLPGTTCVPGQQISCACIGGGTGAQACQDDGQHYGLCEGCPDASGGSGPDATMGGGGPDASMGGGGPDGGADASDAGLEADACPPGLQCDVSCAGGGTTTVTGKVYDPAGKNPVYGVSVYVPAAPLAPLPRGVPTGAEACSCAALFPSGSLVQTVTDADGSFTLNNVPVGSAVPLVLQLGKWRRFLHIPVSACLPNTPQDKSLTLPGTIPAGDTDDNMPDIAVSTGGADTLECIFTRMGLPKSEYVAGNGSTGHVHIFAGGNPSASGGGPAAGKPETPGMAGAPSSPLSLWSTQAQLMPFDLVLLSCEGGETFNANPPALEAYLNAGGRVLAEHFHYAWFAGPLSSGQSYFAPADWGSNLATWSASGASANGPVGGTLETSFPKGIAFQKWMTGVGALGQGVPAGELSIYAARFNAVVGATNKASQPWVIADATSGSPNSTMYFNFDTPVNAPVQVVDGGPQVDAGMHAYCGRAAFSDIHVGGDPSTSDTASPPSGCSTNALSAQEKALEFMLFDLSGCVAP